MKLLIPKGKTSKTVAIFIQDSSVTTGAGLTGLVFNTASLVAYYWRPLGTPTAITLATLAAVTSGWSSGGFIAIDGTNMPGWYRLDIPDAVLASGVDESYISIKGAANMAPIAIEIELTGADFGIAPGTANGLLIAGTNAPITFTGSGAAMTLASTGGNGAGLAVSGNGTGHGLTATGGATSGHGILATGGTSAGDGIRASATGGNSAGVNATGQGSGAGVTVQGGATGHGILTTGGTTSGNGITANGSATSGNGILANAPTAGHGITASGAGSGVGVRGEGGANGNGILGIGGTTSGSGIRGDGTAGGQAGIIGAGNGAGSGIRGLGGTSGPGMRLTGGTSSGAGLEITTTSGDGISIAPTAGHGINSTANGTSKHGMLLTGGAAGTSHGLSAVAGTGGTDINAILGKLMTEAYSAKNGELSIVTALYEIVQQLQESGTAGGTTQTTKKRDQATTAFTQTLNSATAPTTVTRAT